MSGPLFAAFCLARAVAADSAERELLSGPRLGLTATRALGGAVVRNRIKRRLREAFRLHRANLVAPWDIVLNPRRAAVGASFAEVESALMKVLARLETPISKMTEPTEPRRLGKDEGAKMSEQR